MHKYDYHTILYMIEARKVSVQKSEDSIQEQLELHVKYSNLYIPYQANDIQRSYNTLVRIMQETWTNKGISSRKLISLRNTNYICLVNS